MIFEAFEEFDQRGMLINQGDKILKTLKIAGWVVAPDKLVKKVTFIHKYLFEEYFVLVFFFINCIYKDNKFKLCVMV